MVDHVRTPETIVEDYLEIGRDLKHITVLFKHQSGLMTSAYYHTLCCEVLEEVKIRKKNAKKKKSKRAKKKSKRT